MGLFDKILGKEFSMSSAPTNAFMDCLLSFFSNDKTAETMKKGNIAIQEGINSVDESIIHSILMNVYANQGDFEKARNELFRARENLGKAIGLSDPELQGFIHDTPIRRRFDYDGDIFELKHKEAPSKVLMLDELNGAPVRLESMREDLSDEEKKQGMLAFWRSYPSHINSYWLLGDSWSVYNTEEAIKWLKKAIVAVDKNPWSYGDDQDTPPDLLVLSCRYQLGMLYRKKGDTKHAIEEFIKVASAPTHPNWDLTDSQSDGIKEFSYYLISKAKEELG